MVLISISCYYEKKSRFLGVEVKVKISNAIELLY